MSPAPAFARTLHAVRQALRLTQTELATDLGITARTLMRWEQGHVVLGQAEQRLIIQVLAKRDAQQASKLAASLQGTLEDYGVTLPPAPSKAAPRQAANLALYEAAEAADLSPARLRAATLDLLARLDAQGISLTDAQSLLSEGTPAKRRRQ